LEEELQAVWFRHGGECITSWGMGIVE
jgi:hypothetical protein